MSSEHAAESKSGHEQHPERTTGAATNLLAGGVLFAAAAVPLVISGMGVVALLVKPSVTAAAVTLGSGVIGIVLLGGGLSAITGWKIIGRRHNGQRRVGAIDDSNP